MTRNSFRLGVRRTADRSRAAEANNSYVMPMLRLRNGTLIERTAEGSRVTLPCGATVLGHPHSSGCYRATAERLGYGADVTAMALDHDPLHAIMVDWLGLPGSYSLRLAVGLDTDVTLAALEEDAVLAVQRFMRMAGGVLPL